jgi:hypothetical protein
MPEMGVNGPAKVLAIMPTKADSRHNTDPRYKPVTGKFIHDNAEVINLYFTHQDTEPLGVTSNHLLWSVTHGGWMHAGDLTVGDTVKTKNGTETLTKKENKPGRHQVYNLEIHQSHTYYVSNIGVLAHNEYAKPNPDHKYFQAPTQIDGIPGLQRAKDKTLVQGGGSKRKRWKDQKGNIYEWDSQHGALEKYNKRGQHLVVFDHKTGQQT